MFAQKVAKPQAKAAANSTNSLARRRPTPMARPAGQARRLQRPIGNQATLHYLTQRLSNAPTKAPDEHRPAEAARVTGEARNTAWDFSKIPLFPPNRPNRPQAPSLFTAPPLPSAIETKLAVGLVVDPLEHEADRAAEQVLSVPTSTPLVSFSQNHVQRKCVACEEEGRGQEPLRRKASAAGSQPSMRAEAPPIVHEVLHSSGEPLDAATCDFFEQHLGHDFSRVRVHRDGRAAESTRAVNALAYTVGPHIILDTRNYQPHTPAGRKLLAHELTHVVQQTVSDGTLTVDGSQHEREADSAGLAIGLGSTALTIRQRAPIGLARLEDDDGPGSDPSVDKKQPNLPDVGDKGITVNSDGKVCVDIGAGDPLCFSKEGFEDWWKKTHPDAPSLPSRPSNCPPERWRPVFGFCCPEGTVAQGPECVKPEAIPTPPIKPPFPPSPGGGPSPAPAPAPQPAPAPSPAVVEIRFVTDHPHPGETDFDASLRPGERASFNQLLNQLRANPAVEVQLVGRASPEGPGNPQERADYNQRLALRRARMVAAELIKNGIARRASPIPLPTTCAPNALCGAPGSCRADQPGRPTRQIRATAR